MLRTIVAMGAVLALSGAGGGVASAAAGAAEAGGAAEAAAAAAAAAASAQSGNCSADPSVPFAAKLHEQMQVLSWEDRVFVIPNFLSDAEADELIELGHEELTRMHGDEWVHRHAYSNAMYTDQSYADSAALRELDRRIDLLTMVPSHPDEMPIMFTRQIPGTYTGDYLPRQARRVVWVG
jgi:hypothetical protein